MGWDIGIDVRLYPGVYFSIFFSLVWDGWIKVNDGNEQANRRFGIFFLFLFFCTCWGIYGLGICTSQFCG